MKDGRVQSFVSSVVGNGSWRANPFHTAMFASRLIRCSYKASADAKAMAGQESVNRKDHFTRSIRERPAALSRL
jgi:hypothetical protein